MSAAKETIDKIVVADPKKYKSPDSTDEALASLTPELVIALCGPVGSPLHEVSDQLAGALGRYGYKTEQVRLSHFIALNADSVERSIDNSSRYKEIESLISAGDEFRRVHGNDVLSKLAISKIKADREARFGEFNDAAAESRVPAENKIRHQRVCHIIDSVKNKSELELLRLVYGDLLYAVGVFSPLDVRFENMLHSSKGAMSKDDIKKLIDVDSGEEFSHGQSVRDTFPRCDFFLSVDQAAVAATESDAIGQITKKVSRLLSLIFRTTVETPTPDETAMYAAASAARNSACLSRQVGAAVTSASGEVLAVGWNDAPQAMGGLYGKPPLHTNATSGKDRRCFALEGAKCHNDEEKKTIAGVLAKEGLNNLL